MTLSRCASILALLCLLGTVQAKPFANSSFESLAGTEVHVRHWPAASPTKGCPVLLLHGLGGSTYSFRSLAPALAAAGHAVWAMDLPAYGYSARIPFPDTAGAAIAPFLRAKAPGEAWCLLGHSMGTRVVAELLEGRPGSVSRVVYVSGNPIPSARELGNRERFRSQRLRRWFASLVERRYFNETKIRELLGKAYGRAARDDEVQGYLQPLRLPGTALAIMNGYAARWPAHPVATELDGTPSLIIWGERDAWVKPEVADRLQQALPSSQRLTIAGAGHSPMETHPEQTARAVLAHFNRNPG